MTEHTDIKIEPVYSKDNRNKNPCTRCGLEFITNNLAVCKAKNEKCRNCGIIGHFQRMCKRPNTAKSRGNGGSSNKGGMRRIILIGQTTDQSEESSEWDEENVVLQSNGTGVPTFVLKGRINKQLFSVMIDSGSPITTFTREDVRRLLKVT